MSAATADVDALEGAGSGASGEVAQGPARPALKDKSPAAAAAGGGRTASGSGAGTAGTAGTQSVQGTASSGGAVSQRPASAGAGAGATPKQRMSEAEKAIIVRVVKQFGKDYNKLLVGPT
jgi:hypothetical protein